MEIKLINTKQRVNFTHDTVKCRICRNEIPRGASIFQEGLSFGVVCENCYKNNSIEDLELMASIFLAYGGYFGKKSSKNYSIYKIIKKLMPKIHLNKAPESLININIKMMHQALLYGVTPQELIQGLKILLKE
jgi:hypothetical protein